MRRFLFIFLVFLISWDCYSKDIESNPVEGLAERILPGSSKHFKFELEDPSSESDYFEIESTGGKIHICGNNWISVATGLNWYLKYYAHIHITWSNPKQFFTKFPKPKQKERHQTDKLVRYYMDYKTFSYSTPFWDWKRWQQEIDLMALHGINAPLALTGSHAVWLNTLVRLGYSKEEAKQFLPDASHISWWMLGQMEGGCDSLSFDWINSQVELARKISTEYYKWGMTPVLPGFSGIVPSNIAQKLGLKTFNQDKYMGYERPSILDPKDKRFQWIAAIYYEELHKLLGPSKYYAANPFYESSIPLGIDPKLYGAELFNCMINTNEEAVWFIQGWKDSPIIEFIDGLPANKVVAIDVASEKYPKWGDAHSKYYSKEGYIYHDWIYSLKLNYGARHCYMHGNMQQLINGYFDAKESENGRHLIGIGATMDGVDNNPLMWELLSELPWRQNRILAYDWMQTMIHARYGHVNEDIFSAWNDILETLYKEPMNGDNEGACESIFCARPALDISAVTKDGGIATHYNNNVLIKALKTLIDQHELLKYSQNYDKDVRDIASIVNANYALNLLKEINAAFDKSDTLAFEAKSSLFLNAISLQDNLMSTSRETMVGNWIEMAMSVGTNNDDSQALRVEARRLITTWGNREASNVYGMHDYAYKEWSGMLRDFYYERWRAFFSYVSKNHTLPVNYDYFDMENDWVQAKNPYSFTPTTTAYSIATRILQNIETDDIKI